MKRYSIEQSDEQLLGSSASIHYVLRFDRAAAHLIDIQLRIENVAGPIELYLPVWTPGSYKIRDFITNVGDLYATDGNGKPLHIEWLSKNRFRIEHTGNSSTIELQYCYFAHERSVRTSFVNRWHAFLMPGNFCFAIAGREYEPHHLHLHLPPHWQSVATALSPVTPNNTDSLGALNYDILVDSPIQISPDPVHHFSAAGVLHQLSILGESPFTIPWLIEQLQRIVEVEAQLFGGLPYDRYVFMLHFFPDSRGGLEHARSSVSGWDPDSLTDSEEIQRFLTLLAHEFFHVWNGKRIRPIELGPFDYNRENYTSMLWLAEGLTSYYNDLFLYRCGFVSEKSFLRILAQERIQRFLEQPGHRKMSVADSSFLAWVKLYQSNADSPNRFPSYYLKGSLIFLLLDLFLIQQSGGKVSLDTVVQALWQRYQHNPAEGITEAEFIAIAEASTGIPIGSLLTQWLHTTDPLPFEDLFEGIGLQLIQRPVEPETIDLGDTHFTVPPAKVWTGMTLKEVKNSVVVEKVIEGSPADAAGIGVEDTIIAIAGQRVCTPAQAIAQFARHLHQPVSITGSCDGKLYTTQLTPEPAVEYFLEPLSSAPDPARHCYQRWLERPIRHIYSDTEVLLGR